MGIAERVTFQGLIWPNIEIASREPIIYDDLDNAPASAARFHVPIVKPPKPVFYDAPLPWWRNFARDIDFDDDASVLKWARKYGDPFAQGPDFWPTDTKEWPRLADLLTVAAKLWSDPAGDENGISRISSDAAAIADALMILLVDWTALVDWTPKVNAADGTLEIRPSVRNLEQFMLLSAVFDIHDKTIMKRCRWCEDFFAPQRIDALFCSGVCRQASHQATKGAA